MRDPWAILDGVMSFRPFTRASGASVLAATAATLIVGGCGTPAATVTPSSRTSAVVSPAPAAGTFHGTGFSTSIPAGWSDDTTSQNAVGSVNGTGTILMLLVAPDGGHIDTRTAPQPVPDDQLALYLESVSVNGATDLTPAEPVNVGGVSGVLITYSLAASNGVSLKNEDMVVNKGGITYDIVLNTAQGDFTNDLPALQTVLDGWKWG